LAITLTIANQKGGVGKTTTSVNLAAALSRLGKRVLLVDLDPQGNATMGSGIDKRRLTRSVYHVMIGMSDVVETAQICEAGGYSLLPANRELAGAEIELVEFEERETRLKDALHVVRDQYDFILIDAPPSLSLLTLNGLCAAHGVIIPMQCEYYALEGLTDLVNTIRKVHANFNTSIRIIGILRVMFDSRITLAQQVSAQLEEHFKDKVFKSIIPRNIRLAEAPSHGMPGVNFDPSSRGAMGYVEFANELIERMPQFRVTPGSSAAAGAARPATTTGMPATAASDAKVATAESSAGPSAEAGYSKAAANTAAATMAPAAEQPPAQPVTGVSMQAPTHKASRLGAGYQPTDSRPSSAAHAAIQPWAAAQSAPGSESLARSQATQAADSAALSPTTPSHGEQQR
jgi:chromosome partitioning protein